MPTDDFGGYQFDGDGLYDRCLVLRVGKKEQLIALDSVSESSFNETNADGVYKQELTSYLRGMEAATTAQLLHVAAGRFVVFFETHHNRAYTFGSDGGAKLTFGQQNGQLGNASGYSVAISKSSVYPLFEVDWEHYQEMLRTLVLATEDGHHVLTEDGYVLQIFS